MLILFITYAIITLYCTRWGVSGALYLQSATARLMRYLGANLVVLEYVLFMLKLGSYSIVTCESCQGRNTAALSGNTMCFKVALVEWTIHMPAIDLLQNIVCNIPIFNFRLLLESFFIFKKQYKI